MDNVQSPQAARMPSRHSTGHPHAESVAARPIQRTPTKRNFKSTFLTRDNGHLQHHRPGPRPGEHPKRKLVVAIVLGDPSIRGVDASLRKDSTPAGVRDPRKRVLRAYIPICNRWAINAVRLTVQEFRDVISSDGPQSKALINRIICFSSSMTGTRAFWAARGPDPDDVFGDDADVERSTSAQSTVPIAPSTRLPTTVGVDGVTELLERESYGIVLEEEAASIRSLGAQQHVETRPTPHRVPGKAPTRSRKHTLHPDRATVIPIFRRKRQYTLKGQSCTRTQFPLTVAYAITTLDRAVVGISCHKLIPGLSYVAVLRVKTLDRIMFDAPFDHQSICGQVTPARDARWIDAVWHRGHHLPTDADEVDWLEVSGPDMDASWVATSRRAA
ncbi:hypothetical protein E4U45_001069 [Claviceps purpurea]|nr:hypothetical protein E4U45_001069 [Claviceps purpurea]